MLIEIPDDLARKVKKQLVDSAVVHRREAEECERGGLYVDAAGHLLLAAILEADLPELAAYERLRDALRAIDALPIDGAFMSDTLAIVEAALSGSSGGEG